MNGQLMNNSCTVAVCQTKKTKVNAETVMVQLTLTIIAASYAFALQREVMAIFAIGTVDPDVTTGQVLHEACLSWKSTANIVTCRSSR